ncbi:hypothetical protein ElyMa_002751800 [Elysia marginata]|uniref:Uncharacterized protein n=1 Tax=Elysia marginata TaxID=1093978 RepID=A0AAV4HKN2_9GAST|nr:hypothetical protein ElyMa_002751800 [Elysia marginata]
MVEGGGEEQGLPVLITVSPSAASGLVKDLYVHRYLDTKGDEMRQSKQNKRRRNRRRRKTSGLKDKRRIKMGVTGQARDRRDGQAMSTTYLADTPSPLQVSRPQEPNQASQRGRRPGLEMTPIRQNRLLYLISVTKSPVLALANTGYTQLCW